MTVQCVKGERESQTDDGSGKEETKHQFLLQLDLKGGSHEEVDGDTDKRNTSYTHTYIVS